MTQKVAIVHDYLTQRGGAERVVLTLAKIFPDAEIHVALFDPENTFPEFSNLKVRASWLNKIAVFRKHHRLALVLFPAVFRSMKVDAEVTLASSSAFSHAVRASGKLVVYCHTPPRFVYLQDEYLGTTKAGKLISRVLRALVPLLAILDKQAASRAHDYIANSTVVRDRIKRIYNRDSEIIFPPQALAHNLEIASLPRPETAFSESGFYLLVSRLLPYKNVQQVVDAFAGLTGFNLLVIGSGPLEESLKRNLPGNVLLESDVSDDQLRWAYKHARALIAPSHEDFGLTVIEAAAWGTPAIALRAGGYLDTVLEGVSGHFFDSPNPASIRQALVEFNGRAWSDQNIKDHAATFSEESFAAKIKSKLGAV
jgi:glycosyltransferase involved in cell wall biosynthesis